MCCRKILEQNLYSLDLKRKIVQNLKFGINVYKLSFIILFYL